MPGKQINGGMLLLARKRRRKTQTELANESRVPQAAISRIENGTRDALSMEEIQSIARVLGFPSAFFFEQEPLYRRPISLHGAAFRKKASVSVKDQDAVVAMANHYVMQLRRMLDAIELEPQFKLLQFEIVSDRNGAADFAEAVSSASEAAEKVRQSWQLDKGPIENLAKYVEATGVIVIFSDFGDADIDGLTLRPVGMQPVVLLNKNRPADRLRFSLAHEYGHVVLHPYPSEEMEKEANEFAAELLMPRAGVLPDLRKKLTLPYLGLLKLKWGAAMSALIYRGKSLGTLSGDEAVSLWKKMSFCGYRTREPEEFDIEFDFPKLSGDLVDMHMHDLGYSLEELAEAFKTLPAEFAKMHGLETPTELKKPKLRLVVSSN
ncbi:helix-turn-helix domain-containing protein [Thalassospira lohafexi]|uniref:HTH cro/C1-type domain-containing protein n=1 Tax=Thalassospira lohafexi TaxID=744227 RepID=A0A2N3L7R8_9PROT|nr:XRE family transcriptional regulator [Thalassospira lohafexi]PKR58871.1 hypothetical protein COO92_08480 [Thalassospira lohafexi]